jgi:hypothetical protein
MPFAADCCYRPPLAVVNAAICRGQMILMGNRQRSIASSGQNVTAFADKYNGFILFIYYSSLQHHIDNETGFFEERVMMKKSIISAFVLGGALAASPAMAQNSDGDAEFYIGASAGYHDIGELPFVEFTAVMLVLMCLSERLLS